MTAITVGSNKTLLGVGKNGGLKGRGLYLKGSKNVIIQVITCGLFLIRQACSRLSNIYQLIRMSTFVILFCMMPFAASTLTPLSADTINPQFVWGGDAIAIDGGSNIWVRFRYWLSW